MVTCRQSSPVQPNSKIMQIVPPRKNPNSYNSRSQLPQQKKRTNVKMLGLAQNATTLFEKNQFFEKNK